MTFKKRHVQQTLVILKKVKVISQRTVALSIAVGSLDEVDDGFAVTHIALAVNATIADISIAQCQTVCKQTKKDCPISKLFNTEISLNATLK